MFRMRILRRFIFNAAIMNSDIKTTHITTPTARKPKEEVDVVIVGAGLAGLSAAAHLLKNGFRRTVILEATERLGGRVNSKRFGDAFCELGAKWIAVDSTKDSIYEILRQTNGIQKRIRQKSPSMYVNERGQMLNKRLTELVDMLFKQVCSGIEFQEKNAAGELYNLKNVQTYLDTESKKITEALFDGEEKKVARDIFKVLAKEFGSTLGCCLAYVNIGHITQLPKENAWPLYVPSGLDNLLCHIAKDIGQNQVHVGKPVGEIHWLTHITDEPKIVGCLDGTAYPADHILCTLPLGVLKNFSEFMFSPSLPEPKRAAIKNIGFGTPVKMYLDYNNGITQWFKGNFRPLWDAAEHENRMSLIKQIVEISSVPSSNHVLEVSIGGEYYEQIEKLPDVEVLEEITQLLRKFLKNPRIPYPSSLLRSNWSTSACYLGGRPFISTESRFSDVLTLAEPLGDRVSLLFAGDATTLSGFGTIDGARMSGIREAERIIKYYN